MATQPKKKPSRKKSKKTPLFKKNIWIVLGVLAMISLVAFGYFLGQKQSGNQEKKNEILNDLTKIKIKNPSEERKIPVKTSVEHIDVKQVVPKKQAQEKNKLEVNTKKSSKIKNTALAFRGKKPKLVIVIDDIHSKEQIKTINDLQMKITPSIFPPYPLSKHSNLLANDVKNYMIHLPMQSGNKQFNKQYKTLMTSFSDKQIEARVKELRQLFPNGIYVNNHTGSTYTQNYRAMKKLYNTLRQEGFVFVDSYTIASSKVRKIAHEFGDAYVSRDIFIDNEHKVSSIHKQLKKAVVIAKKKGYALVIGHPHKVTMKALKSAGDILKDVDLVYMDDIYK